MRELRLRDLDRGGLDLLRDLGARDLSRDGESRDLLADPGMRDLLRSLGTAEAADLGAFLRGAQAAEVALSTSLSRSAAFSLTYRHR